MKRKAHGQVRRSQVITTYGPGALIDLPHESAIVAGLDEWPPPHKLEEIDEPRLARKLRTITGVAVPRMVAPPPVSSDPGATPVGIGAWRFPEWFVVQEADPGDGHVRSRRLVHRKALDDHRRFEGRPVVATTFGVASESPISRVEGVHAVSVYARAIAALTLALVRAGPHPSKHAGVRRGIMENGGLGGSCGSGSTHSNPKLYCGFAISA